MLLGLPLPLGQVPVLGDPLPPEGIVIDDELGVGCIDAATRDGEGVDLCQEGIFLQNTE